jgi:hypothetical protein
MTDTTSNVRKHYNALNLTDRIKVRAHGGSA